MLNLFKFGFGGKRAWKPMITHDAKIHSLFLIINITNSDLKKLKNKTDKQGNILCFNLCFGLGHKEPYEFGSVRLYITWLWKSVKSSYGITCHVSCLWSWSWCCFPIKACPKEFYSFYTTAMCHILYIWSIKEQCAVIEN